MLTPHLSDDWLTFYNGSFCRDAHQLIALGYEDARSIIRSDHLEEQITGFIVDAIEKRLNNPHMPQRFRRYSIHEDEYTRGTSRTGRSRQRIDIVIKCSIKLPRPAFMFEAKLLRKGKFTIGRYTGDEGMQCYIRGEYAAQYPAAAMIGYLQSDDFDYWFKQLYDKLEADEKKDLFVTTPLQKIEVCSLLSHEWISRHKRVNSTDIDIFHIFLDCTTS